MDLDSVVSPVVDFVRDHRAWAAPIAGVLAFCESLAFLSLLVPATVILIGIGGLLGAAGLGLTSPEFWTVVAAGAIGATGGDWLSYEVGRRYDERAKQVWPLSRHPAMVASGERFVTRFGVGAIFLGRFFGPARAVVPLIAGIFAMPRLPFQLANVASAIVWSIGLLAPGAGLLAFLRS